jgi:hypothetical protein
VRQDFAGGCSLQCGHVNRSVDGGGSTTKYRIHIILDLQQPGADGNLTLLVAYSSHTYTQHETDSVARARACAHPSQVCICRRVPGQSKNLPLTNRNTDSPRKAI